MTKDSQARAWKTIPFHCLPRHLTCVPTHMRRATAAVLALSTLLCAVDAARLAPKLPDPRAGASAVSASNSTETTGCEACCGGGSCSSAFRGTPGTCCGVVDDQSFCCPTAASSFGEGQCYRPDASTFRCRAAGTSRDSGDDRPSPWYSLFSLLIPVALLAACCMACFRKPRTQQPMPVGQQYYGQGAPPPGAVYGYPATGQPYQVSAVSSGLVTSELAIPRSSRASTPRRALFSARERAGGGRRSEKVVIF